MLIENTFCNHTVNYGIVLCGECMESLMVENMLFTDLLEFGFNWHEKFLLYDSGLKKINK
jgi:hypothetical protein